MKTEKTIDQKWLFLINLFGILLCIFLFQSWLSDFSTRVVGDDSLEVNYPLLSFEKNALKEGFFPFWNPYSQAGTPDFSSPFYDFFYPLHWIILLFPITLGINISFLIHIGIGWVGTYLFFRTFVGTVGATVGAWMFILSGPPLHFVQAGYLGTFYSVVGMPWCLWILHLSATEENPWRSCALALTAGLILAFCLNVIASYALVFNVLPSFIYLLVLPTPIRKRITSFALFMLGGIILCAVRLWPWYLLTLETNRSGMAADLSFSAAGSIHPIYLLNYLIPGFLPGLDASGLLLKGYRGSQWPISFGLIPVILLGKTLWISYKGRFLSILYVLSIGLVMGIYSPIFLFFFFCIPGFSVTSHPNIYLWLAAFSGAGMVAIWLQESDTMCRYQRKIAIVLVILILSSIFFMLLLPLESRILDHFLNHREDFSPGKILSYALEIFGGISFQESWEACKLYCHHLNWSRLAWVAFWIGLFVFVSSKNISTHWKRVFLLSCFALDVLFQPLPRWDLSDPSVYFPANPLHSKIVESIHSPDSEPVRVYPVGGTYNTPFFKFNQGCLMGIENIKGETGFFLRDSGRYFNRITGWPISVRKRYAQFYGTMNRLDSRLLDLLNVKYFLSDTSLFDRDLKLTDTEDNLYLYENIRVVPRAILSGRVERVDSIEKLYERIEKDEYDPTHVLFTNETIQTVYPPSTDTTPQGFIHTRRHGPNSLVVDVQTDTDAWVCISEIMIPGWQAKMDDKIYLNILKVNGLFQAFIVPAGKHQVVISYKPHRFLEAASISSIGLIILTFIWFMSFFRAYISSPKI